MRRKRGPPGDAFRALLLGTSSRLQQKKGPEVAGSGTFCTLKPLTLSGPLGSDLLVGGRGEAHTYTPTHTTEGVIDTLTPAPTRFPGRSGTKWRRVQEQGQRTRNTSRGSPSAVHCSRDRKSKRSAASTAGGGRGGGRRAEGMEGRRRREG